MIRVVVLAIATSIATAGSAAAQLIAPGEMSEAHRALDGDGHCLACHKEGKKVDGARCLACHEPLARRIAAGRGLHGRGYKGQPCEDCHVEHNGRGYKLIRWPGGAMAKLDHAEAGWRLDGAHARASCLGCHARKNSLGKPSFLGLEPSCAGCHADVHAGRFGAGCASCHGQVDWKVTAARLETFDHARARFALRGAHAEVACGKCHRDPPTWRGIAFDGCARCHADPHEGRLDPRCQSCHVETRWSEVAPSFRDAHPGVSLGGGHREVRCRACHDAGTERRPSKGKTCVACHAPVHEAKFGDACGRCHAGIRWLGLPRQIGLEAHDRTPYPLSGRHQTIACARCHSPAKPPAERFRGLTFDRCGACHADAHRGEFAARDAGECATCHTTGGFAPTLFGVTAHAATRFPLEGRHQGTACGRCHPGARPRTDLRVGKQTCAECHANPHGTQFAREMAAGGCARCHTAAGWDQAKVDHSTWPLTGAHGRTACARCHGAVDRRSGGAGAARAFDAAAYRGVPRDCEGCHEDLHAGQFRSTAPVRTCDGCHTTERFALPAFAHARATGYVVDGKHAGLACAACHPSESLANGARAVRYRLGFRACADCHASPHRGTP